MAREDDLDLDVDGAEQEAPKSKSKLLIIIAGVVLLLGVSGAATLALTGVLSGDAGSAEKQAALQGEDAASSADKPSKKAKARKDKAPLAYVPLDPPFVVNFSSDTDVRFLQISVEVGTREPAVADSIKEHRPAIRNSLVMLFSSQDPHDLDSREGKETLRNETLAEVQKVLKQETGGPGVESVFFTSFVMQ
jgi:flagellar FliL protein